MKTSRVRVSNERDQRVLAVMYLNPDGIEDPGGHALDKVRKYMAVRYNAGQVRSSVYRLEQLGLLLRISGKPTGVSQYGKPITPCVGVIPQVERDELGVEQEYVDELRIEIQKRMEAKAAKTEPQPERIVVRRPKKAEEPVVGGGASIPPDSRPMAAAEAIADALLAKVIERAQASTTDQQTVNSMLDQIETLQRRLELADKNADTLVKNMNTMAEENERLKKAAANVAGRAKRGEWLTSSIKELVGDEAWNKLSEK